MKMVRAAQMVTVEEVEGRSLRTDIIPLPPQLEHTLVEDQVLVPVGKSLRALKSSPTETNEERQRPLL